MRDHSKHIQVDRNEAAGIIIRHTPRITSAESVPVIEAVGRVLAEDAVSRWDNPNMRTARMDSVAVRWDDFAGGMPDTADWVRGRDWDFANTGVAMPEGFDTAIPVEQVMFSDNDTKVAFKTCPSARFDGTSAPGSIMKAGEELVTAGTELTPILASYIANGNNAHVLVLKKPVVAFIPTGNELIHAGKDEVPAGKNVESTSITIAEKVRSWGGEPLISDIVKDDREALKTALLAAAEQADIVVLNAGSSKGSDDWGMEALEEIGTVLYHEVNHGPGHHSSFSVVNGTPVIGLSGPPDGGAITADLYLYPAVRAALGQEPHLKKVKARLAESFERSRSKSGKNKKRQYETGAFYVVKQMKLSVSDDGILKAWPPEGSHLSPLQAGAADAYYLLLTSREAMDPQPGEIIEVELKPR
ncbi:MAG: molybdopterin molybdotransferase MoeA [Lachnospiraceae bacterium]|nr:molybdopterin molybdotransferase MoeA [Lachnospiraceae bacterium]